MIYLQDNPLLQEPLKPEHIKNRLLGHWGSSPGLAFIYIHLNRLIKKYDLDMIFLAGPGHGAPGVLGPGYLEGTYSEIYPDKSEDEEGLREFFKQFSFPGGIGSHCTPETPGSIHEGGELGYVLSHACGAAFDNPDLIVAAVVGDGESETGPLATSWHINKFLNPIRDGAVLPDPAPQRLQDQQPDDAGAHHPRRTGKPVPRLRLDALLRRRLRPDTMHQAMAATVEHCVPEIRKYQQRGARVRRSRAPALADDRAAHAQGLDAPRGGGRPQAGRLLARPPGAAAGREERTRSSSRLLENWMRAQKPEELFDENGKLIPELKELAPTGTRRMGANPHANGGLLKKALRLPDFRDYGVTVEKPGTDRGREHPAAGPFLRDVMKPNMDNFRVFGPDENTSNKLERHLRGQQEILDRGVLPGGRRRRRTGPRRPRDGDAQRAHPGRHARRLPAHRPARLLLHLRSVRPRHRLDVQPARQVAVDLQSSCPGAKRSPR